jgi:hypothetical protein
MDPENKALIKKAAAGLERSLEVFETYLEAENNRPLYEATLCMVDALKRLHGVDPALLCAANLARVEAMLQKEKRVGGGRDSFNTGF